MSTCTFLKDNLSDVCTSNHVRPLQRKNPQKPHTDKMMRLKYTSKVCSSIKTKGSKNMKIKKNTHTHTYTPIAPRLVHTSIPVARFPAWGRLQALHQLLGAEARRKRTAVPVEDPEHARRVRRRGLSCLRSYHGDRVVPANRRRF